MDWYNCAYLHYLWGVNFSIFKTTLINKVYLYFRVKNKLIELAPSWWEISHIGLITISKTDGHYGPYSNYEIYIKARCKIDNAGVLGCIVVDMFGQIIKSNISYRIKESDDFRGITDEVKKKYSRDKSLIDLGIK